MPKMATQKGKPPGKKARPVKEDRKTKRIQENSDIKALQKAVEELDVKATPTKFGDLPLSAATRAGLRDSHFETLTDIQARAIPAALQGADILGASKTGSGKTLAFLVPVLEKLYRARWSNKLDGLGALIVSPTRELSVQIFEVLRKIGRHHDLSAGLITGGKDLREEAESIGGLNILVCTPGRMLQHLDQTAGLDVDNLQMLVLDEADRIMDMGFQACIDALVEHLPTTRQTLLFSATQSRKVSDLARLSLRDPQYIAVHEAAAAATPTLLQQAYVLTPLPEKLDTLYSFLRANLKSKMICFFSSGKQVRFVYEAFRSMQPGITLLHLHGRQKQTARLEILSRFSRAQHACLLATDVVARGVDIPLVDWVVQVDCPEDADTYIHRSGRTARYNSKGKAILFLDPSEEAGMVERLKQKNVPIFKTAVKERKKQSISEALQKLCFERHDIKYLAQKSFVSYTRSVHLQRDKEVFRIDALDLDGFAKSLGLAGAPQIRFRQGEDLKKIKNASRAMLSSGSEDEDEDDEGGEEGAVKKSKKKKDGQVRTKAQRMFERTNQDVLTRHYQNLIGSEDDDDDGEDEGGAQTGAKAAANGKGSRADDEGADFFSTKRVMDDKALAKAAGLGDGVSVDDNTNEASAAGKPKVLRLGGERELVIDSKRREKLIRSKKQLLKFKPTSTKLVFDDDGNAQPVYQLQDEADFQRLGPAEQQRQQFVEAEADRVRVADVEDKAVAKEKRREKRLKRKMRERAEEDGGDFEGDDGGVATVGGGHGGLFGEDGDDGLALLRSLPMVGEEGADSDASTHNNREAAPPRKKQKKRVERDSDSDGADIRKREKKSKPKRHKNKVIELDDVPDKLEDLEALATGLLDG